MPEVLSGSFVASKNAMHNQYPWAFLFEADLDGTNGIRIAGHDASISWNGKLWVPFPIIVASIPRDAEGDLPLIEVRIGNLSREVSAYLEADGIIDRIVHLYLVNTQNLAAADKQDWGEWTVQDAQVNLEVAVLRIGQYNLFEAPYCNRRQHRSRCDLIYGAGECGYLKTLPNLIAAAYPNFSPTTCDLTRDGGNGCRVHGHNEVANGKVRQHPNRAGFHAGIPKGPARV